MNENVVQKKRIRICWSNENHDADGETKCIQGDYNHLVDYLFFSTLYLSKFRKSNFFEGIMQLVWFLLSKSNEIIRIHVSI